jgi:hypothetical protein
MKYNKISIILSIAIGILALIFLIYKFGARTSEDQSAQIRLAADEARVKKLAMATAEFINEHNAYPNSLDDVLHDQHMDSSCLQSSEGEKNGQSPPYFELTVDRQTPVAKLSEKSPVVATRKGVLPNGQVLVGFFDGHWAKTTVAVSGDK